MSKDRVVWLARSEYWGYELFNTEGVCKTICCWRLCRYDALGTFCVKAI